MKEVYTILPLILSNNWIKGTTGSDHPYSIYGFHATFF